jgi:hypothetical protein
VVILRYLLDEDARRQVGGNREARSSDADDHASLVADDAEQGALADAHVAKTPGGGIAEREEADLEGRPLRCCGERDGGAGRASSGASHGGSTSRSGVIRVERLNG